MGPADLAALDVVRCRRRRPMPPWNKLLSAAPSRSQACTHALLRFGGQRRSGSVAPSLPGRQHSRMERLRKDYSQMRRVLEGREPASAAVAILSAGTASPTDAARSAAGWALAAMVAAAATQAQPTGSLPKVLHLFAVTADGLYPAALQLQDLAWHAQAAFTCAQPSISVEPLPGSYGGARLCAVSVPCRMPP